LRALAPPPLRALAPTPAPTPLRALAPTQVRVSIECYSTVIVENMVNSLLTACVVIYHVVRGYKSATYFDTLCTCRKCGEQSIMGSVMKIQAMSGKFISIAFCDECIASSVRHLTKFLVTIKTNKYGYAEIIDLLNDAGRTSQLLVNIWNAIL
jgi:hypothetical protein